MTAYETFYQLHQQAGPFLLPNAWNVKSAKLIEAAGFPAIATSSGAIADSLGYPDGEQIPFNEMLYIIQRIKASTNLPLSVDCERGYTSDLSVITDHIQQLLDIGVAGINIEDAEGETVYLKKLESIRNYLIQTEKFVDGKWMKNRTINGDEFGIKLPPNPYDLASDIHIGEVTVLKVKLYNYLKHAPNNKRSIHTLQVMGDSRFYKKVPLISTYGNCLNICCI